jgi:hypothetical protein
MSLQRENRRHALQMNKKIERNVSTKNAKSHFLLLAPFSFAFIKAATLALKFGAKIAVRNLKKSFTILRSHLLS